MHFMETDGWNWGWALKQFDINRNELSNRPQRHVGFGNNHPAVRGFVRRTDEDDIPF
jgi:hypothetical protein